jgi:hypothetical protein
MSGLLQSGDKKPQKAQEHDLNKQGIDLFFGQKEREFMERVGKELVIGILKESFILYRIDYKRTQTHSVYGETKRKIYLPEIEIFGRINVESNDPEYFAKSGLIRKGYGKITAEVYLSHLEEKGVKIRMGDFVYHKGNFYEIIDDGSSNIGNENAFGGDKLFYIRIKGVEVNSDVFNGR